MNTVEPIWAEWAGKGIETDENYQERFTDRWDETTDFLFHNAAIELCDEISPYTLQEKYSEIVESEIEPLKDVLPVPEQQIRMGNVSSGRTSRVYYVRGETVIVPSRRFSGTVRLVSNNKNAARDLRDKFKAKLREKAESFHGAGIEEINISDPEDFTLRKVKQHNAEMDTEVGEPEDFEEQILDELKPLSESFVSNVSVDFKNYSPCPEFDIMFAPSPRLLIQIEVKDYSGVDDEPGEDDAIHRPLRRASLLDVAKTYTVIRGVEEDTMEELKKNSELRNQIEIVEKRDIVDAIQPIVENSIRGAPATYVYQ